MRVTPERLQIYTSCQQSCSRRSTPPNRMMKSLPFNSVIYSDRNCDPAISGMSKNTALPKRLQIHENCQRRTNTKSLPSNRMIRSFPFNDDRLWPKLCSSPFRFVKAGWHRRSSARHEQFEPITIRMSAQSNRMTMFFLICHAFDLPKLRPNRLRMLKKCLTSKRS